MSKYFIFLRTASSHSRCNLEFGITNLYTFQNGLKAVVRSKCNNQELRNAIAITRQAITRQAITRQAITTPVSATPYV